MGSAGRGVQLRLFGICLVVLILSLTPGMSALASPPESDETRADMDRILEAMSSLLPLSLREGSFERAENREAILASLQVLVNAADSLERHAKRRDPTFEFMGRRLASDVHDIRRRYARGRYEEARYLLQQLTETCVACHSRLPESSKRALGERLTKQVDLDSLETHEKARLQVATRQFDAALATYVALFADRSVPPARMDLEGAFVDYLTLSIRVIGDLEQAVPVLKKFAQRSDLPFYLLRNVEIWIASLLELRKEKSDAPPVEHARSLVERARELGRYSSDRAGLVYDLMASSVLHRYVESVPEKSPELAEAFYLLGVTEWRTRRSYWVSETEFYLETAIRVAPRSSYAEKAYALLEEYTVLGYSGSGGIHVPPDVQARLDELYALVAAPD